MVVHRVLEWPFKSDTSLLQELSKIDIISVWNRTGDLNGKSWYARIVLKNESLDLGTFYLSSRIFVSFELSNALKYTLVTF